MELLLAGAVVALVTAVVGFALPSWWWLAGPPVLFGVLVLIAASAGDLEGEAGFAMVFVFIVLIPFAVLAMCAVAVGVGLGKRAQRREAPPAIPPPAIPPDPGFNHRPEAPYAP